jgi:hypothetical protein
MLSQGIRRAPGMIQGAARGAMQGVMQAPSTMREALMQTQPQQNVAEILSQGLPEMMPDLGGATSSASRQRQIADMLLQGAQSQDNTSIAGGLSQLGQAFLARKAGQKADTAETEREQITRDLLARATGGGPDAAQARAQLEGGDVASALTRYDAQQAAAQAAQKEQERLAARQNIPGLTDPQRAALAAGIGEAEVGKMLFAPPAEAQGASSPLGKIAADLQAGFITQEQADAAIAAQTGGMTDYQRAQLEAAAAAPQAPAARPMREDPNGVLRYLDGAQEPVFSNVTTAPAPAKPLIGAESMGRVAAGLPNMRQAVTDLKSALGVNIQGGTATTSEGGYRPDQDWGALVLDNIPFTGDVIARVAGGEDYQKFDNAYSTFEAAALPIMSGAAVTDSEAKRALKALRVRIGDTDQAVARKMANMDRMVSGLEAAARGDTAALQSIVGVVNSGSTTTAANGLPPGFIVIE